MNDREPISVLVAGLGNMGLCHGDAYRRHDGFRLAGLVKRDWNTAPEAIASWPAAPRHTDFRAALEALRPQAVSINTWVDTHADYAIAAMEAGAHVFVEKPLARSVAEARAVVDTARRTGRKLVVGYILRHHPSWIELVRRARELGTPKVLRMNLNQQSSGAEWQGHKTLMRSQSPLVDCGVHYVDVMCRITGSRPVRVHGMGARLSPEIAPDMYNYGHLQVFFEDGSVGWYEAGWGPMMSETAYFVKDVVGPKGSVSIVMSGDAETGSADINLHTRTSSLLIHSGAIDARGALLRDDLTLDMSDEPDHQALCDREQEFFHEAIRRDLDLTDSMEDAVNSLAIVLAADRSIRERRPVDL